MLAAHCGLSGLRPVRARLRAAGAGLLVAKSVQPRNRKGEELAVKAWAWEHHSILSTMVPSFSCFIAWAEPSRTIMIIMMTVKILSLFLTWMEMLLILQISIMMESALTYAYFIDVKEILI